MIPIDKYVESVNKHWTTWKAYDEEEKTPATFCNMFVRDCVTDLCGKDLFKNKMANDIYDYLKDNATKLPSSFEGKMFYSGDKMFSLVIAAVKGKVHGHVAIIMPEKYVYAPKWKQWCPKCANIGKENLWEVGVNFCFKDIPDYFSLDFKKEY